jgi:hypothetical protein
MMSEQEELKKMVREAVELAEDNNRMLHKMIRASRLGRIFKFLYWAVIIVLMLGAYYYIQPFIDNLFAAYAGLMQNIESIQKTGEAVGEIPVGFLENIKGLLQ